MTEGDASSFEEACLEVIRQVEAGDVLTYGEVAEAAGRPGAARAVGNLLRRTGADLPWWRVVAAGGRLVAPSAGQQSELLAREGWIVEDLRLAVPPVTPEEHAGRTGPRPG